MSPLSLYELNALVRDTLAAEFDADYWLAAELSEVRVAAGGHCYLEFVEKSGRNDALVAKAKGNIWRPTYAVLAPCFERTAGRPLAAGMKVLVSVRVTFHELYGYALNVTDIDPTYTLGDLTRRRREILARLDEDGVLTLNKELALPRLLVRIAVVSSASAAGYGDFCRQLEQSGFPFRTKLFVATMQGDGVESSVVAALDRIATERENWDAVVIIRGGGAASDLNGFETYTLAANVAQFPLPVLTGIGHERDDTVIDLVAHTRLKTPTAVAAFLVEARRREYDLVDDLQSRLDAAAQRCMERPVRQFQQLARRFQLATTRFSGGQRERLVRFGSRMERAVMRQLRAGRERLAPSPVRLELVVRRCLDRQRHRLELYGKSLSLAGPERILRMGYSITLHNGRPVRDAAQLRAGDVLVTRLEHGTISSTVNDNT